MPLIPRKIYNVINVKVEFGDGETRYRWMRLQNGRRNISPNRKLNNKMIQEYVEKKYGFKVHTAYVAG